MKDNKIFTDELKRTIPIYILGIFFHSITIYIHYKIPSILGNILDLLLQGEIQKQIIMVYVYTLLFYSIIMIVPRILYRTLLFRTARISDTYLRKKVVEHLQYVKPEYYDKEEKGTYLAYLSKELVMVRKFFGNFFFNIARLVVAPILGIIMIGKNVNLVLAVCVLPIIPICVIWIFKLYKDLKEKIEEARKVGVEYSKIIEQNTSGFSLIKLYNEQNNQKAKFEKINKRTYETDYEIGAVKNKIANVMNILYASCYSLGFAVSVYLIYKNTMTLGDLTVYIACISLVLSEIMKSIEPLLDGWAYFKQARRRFNYFFNLETYKTDGKELKEIQKIEIDNLSYYYIESEKPAISNIKMTIHKGQKIGIVGQVGSGKTTLMNILAGFYEVPDNTIKINDIDINQYNRQSIFKKIGYSTQKGIILDENIKNNIDMKNERKQEDIEKVIRKAELLEDIEKMEEKFETQIGENGSKVSGGQKQRIQIARTLLNTREINIFDDSLSALDSETEKKVLKAIENEVGKNTLIVVSNKVSMMENMDKVYLLIDGKIEASGTHKQLLETNKLYQELNAIEHKEYEEKIKTF